MKHPTLIGGAAWAAALVLASGTAAHAASLPQAVAAGTAIEFDVDLPLQHSDELDQLLQQLHDPSSANFRHWLTPEEFQSRFGASASDITAVGSALAAKGFTIVSNSIHGVHVAGTAAAVHNAFGATLMSTGPGRALVVKQKMQMPAVLSTTGARVIAFSSVPHHVHSRSQGVLKDNRYGPDGPYWFDDLKQAYDFPTYQALTGKGRTIAIVMSSDYLNDDMKEYFGHEKLAVPNITRVPVCVPLNPPAVTCGSPFDPNSGASLEVSLDIQQSGGMAPKAKIRLYNVPDLSDQSVMAAYQEIVDKNAADIVSSSFGGPEGEYTAAFNGGTDFTYILQQYEDIFRQGNAQGITFVASSGDDGGLGLPSVNYGDPTTTQPIVFTPGVEAPADSPHVTAVGGTNLVTTDSSASTSLKSAYVKENAFGDPEVPYDIFGLGQNVSGGYWGSGGGVSVVFPKPIYQYLVNTGASTRAVPDISLQMGGCPLGLAILPCPLDGTDRSGTVVAFDVDDPVNGGLFGVIGTSVSAPGFAGLLALEEEHLGGVRLGNVNVQIYTLALLQHLSGGGNQSNAYYHQGIPGFNGYEHSGNRGYNQVLGVGTVFARTFIGAPFVAPAGNPQTPSNP